MDVLFLTAGDPDAFNPQVSQGAEGLPALLNSPETGKFNYAHDLLKKELAAFNSGQSIYAQLRQLVQ